MAYITKEYLENNIKNYDQYRKLDKEGQANGLATLDANGKLVSSQIPSGVGAVTYNGNPVTSLVAGTSITLEHDETTGALTIIGPAGGLETIAGVGLTRTDTATTRTIKLKTATYDKLSGKSTISGLGGIKVAMGGAKAFTYDWNSTNDAAPSITPSAGDVPVTVYQPNRANGKYYPVECTNDSAAVVCIPNVPSPFYDNSNNGVSASLDNSTSPTLLTIAFDTTDIIFERLDYISENSDISKASSSGTLTLSNTELNFTSITENNPAYAYLRFTTVDKFDSNDNIISKGHTYNATVKIWYEKGNIFAGTTDHYESAIII